MKKLKDFNISTKLGSILVLFIVIAFVNYLSVNYFKQKQKSDAAVVDAAGRNRMLSQRIAFFVECIAKGDISVKNDLRKAIDLHSTSLQALKLGGISPGIANDEVLPPTIPNIMPSLLEVEKFWQDYKSKAILFLKEPLYIDSLQVVETRDTTGLIIKEKVLIKVKNPILISALNFIENNAALMLQKNNYLVKRYVAENSDKQAILNKTLLMLLGINILLIGLGFYIIKRFIVEPLKLIGEVSYKLAKGDLTQKVDYMNQDEIGRAINYMNEMIRNLDAAATFAEAIGQHRFDIDYKTAGDNDRLGKTLIDMHNQLSNVAKENEKRNWTVEGLAKFSNLLHKNKKIENLGEDIIINLVRYLKANQGALFILNEDNCHNEKECHLELLACYAWDRTKFLEKKLKLDQGLIGQCWQERNTIFLTEIPENFINISSGLGDARPNCILIVPLKNNQECCGVIEIASFKVFDDFKIDFVEKLAENIGTILSNLKINERTKFLLRQSQQQAEELKAQEEELRQNHEELQSTQEEMKRQKNDLEQELGVYKERLATLKLTPKCN